MKIRRPTRDSIGPFSKHSQDYFDQHIKSGAIKIREIKTKPEPHVEVATEGAKLNQDLQPAEEVKVDTVRDFINTRMRQFQPSTKKRGVFLKATTVWERLKISDPERLPKISKSLAV